MWEEFRKLGDVNLDGVIDRRDLDMISACYGKSVEECPECDLNGDGTIDVLDLTICGNHQGLNIYDYYGVVRPEVLGFGIVAGTSILLLIGTKAAGWW